MPQNLGTIEAKFYLIIEDALFQETDEEFNATWDRED